MNKLTNQRSALKPILPELTYQPDKTRGMAASWFVVNGKLTCKWFPVEN